MIKIKTENTKEEW